MVWKIGIINYFDIIFCSEDFIWYGVFIVVVVLGCQVDNYIVRFYGVNYFMGNQFWCWFVWNKCGGDNDIDFFCLGGKEFYFCFDECV